MQARAPGRVCWVTCFAAGCMGQRAEMLAEAGEQHDATTSLRAAIAIARETGAAFFELLALAAAQRLRNPAADPARPRTLLAL